MATEYQNLLYPLTVVQGNDWETDFQVLVEDNLGVQTPVDLTNFTISGGVKLKRTDSAYAVTFTPNLTDAVNGKFKISLTDTQTTGLTLGSLYYQVDLTVSGFTQTYVAGSFFVR